MHRLGSDPGSVEHVVAKAVALYVAADLPGQAFDIIDMGARAGCRGSFAPLRVKQQIEAAYRWAKLEYGARELMRLTRRGIGLRGTNSEP